MVKNEVKKSKSSSQTRKVVAELDNTSSSVSDWNRGYSPKKNIKFIVPAVIVLVLLGIAGYFFRDKFLAATVNGKPVFRFTLTQKLVSTYGKETLENLIVEQLIKEEAKKRSIVVSEDEIKAEIDKVTKSLGSGLTLEDALKYQGITLANFKEQLKIRIAVNKILEKEITVSSDEVDKFIKDNASSLTASGEAERKAEAESKLKDQKINEKIQTWVSDLLSKAKITRFLK